MKAACEDLGVEIRTDAEVKHVNVANGTATGVTLVNGEVVDAKLVASNADPKRTFLGLVEASELGETFRREVQNIRMDGPAGKVNFVLSEEPRVTGMPADRSRSERSLFTLIPTLQAAEDNYNASRRGDLPSATLGRLRISLQRR